MFWNLIGYVGLVEFDTSIIIYLLSCFYNIIQFKLYNFMRVCRKKKNWIGNQVADYFDADKLLVETSVSEYMSMANTQ